MEAQQIVLRELNAGEILLWTGRPDPVRSMRSTLGDFIFGFGWTAFMINAIVLSHSRHRDIPGSSSLFQMQDLFFVPFILVGGYLLLSPWFVYQEALKTVYAVTNHRLMIISFGKTFDIKTYLPESINILERTEYANGTGTVAFSRASNRDRDGDSHSINAEFVGILDARAVEELIQKTFNAPR